MVRVSTYLNFMGNTEEAMDFYKSIFRTDYETPPMRMKDMPMDPNGPVLAEGEEDKIMYVALPILAGHVVMGTDMLESMGHVRIVGNNVTINLELEDRIETERLFGALTTGSSDNFGMQDMPWGAYWGTCLDRYGVRWMFNCATASGRLEDHGTDQRD